MKLHVFGFILTFIEYLCTPDKNTVKNYRPKFFYSSNIEMH